MVSASNYPLSLTLHLATWGNLSLRHGIRMLVVPMACILTWGLGCPKAIALPRTSSRVLVAPSVIAQANSEEPINLLPDFAPDLAQQLSELEFAQNDAENDSDNSTETRPALRLDDSGEAVERLQQQLQAAGFYEGEITGRFDLDTEASVLALQEQEGLQVDGIMGQDSWDRLEAQQPTPDPASGPLDLDNIGNESDEETPRDSTSSGLGLMWWVAGGAILVVIAGGLFVILLKAFREDVDEDEVNEDPVNEDPVNQDEPILEDESNFTPVSENSPDLTPSAKAENGRVSQEPAAEAEIPGHDSPWETPEAPPQPQAFPDLPVDVPSEPKKPVTAEGTAIASQKPASSALTRLPRMSIVEALILDLQHPDPERRRKAIWELGQRGDSRAITPLVE